MDWLHVLSAFDVSYFFGGAFLANAVPPFVSGIMGRPFQRPFARPPGKGLSSSTVIVLWGFAIFAARACGRFHGGSKPTATCSPGESLVHEPDKWTIMCGRSRDWS